MKLIPETIGDVIRLRAEQFVNMDEAAVAMATSRQQLWRVMTGKTPPTARMLETVGMELRYVPREYAALIDNTYPPVGNDVPHGARIPRRPGAHKKKAAA